MKLLEWIDRPSIYGVQSDLDLILEDGGIYGRIHIRQAGPEWQYDFGAEWSVLEDYERGTWVYKTFDGVFEEVKIAAIDEVLKNIEYRVSLAKTLQLALACYVRPTK